MMLLASFPSLPDVRDVITLPDGVIGLVTARKFKIARKTDSDGRHYYYATPTIFVSFTD